MDTIFARIEFKMKFTYWRLKRGRRNDTVKITHFLLYNPGASLEQITDSLWGNISNDSRRSFDSSSSLILDALARYGVIENNNGWRLKEAANPFAKLTATTNDSSELIEAFGELVSLYSGTIERRLAGAIAKLLADSQRPDDMRRLAYIHFLIVLGIPTKRWPTPSELLALSVPNDFDWAIIKAFLPRDGKRKVGLL